MKLLALAAASAGVLASATNEWHENNKWQQQQWQPKSWHHSSWQRPQKYEVEYGYDTAYVQLCDHSNYHTGKYQCVRGHRDTGDELCKFSYVTDCHEQDKDAVLVRKFWKKVYYDEELEQDCNSKPHYWYSDYVSNRWHRALASGEVAMQPVAAASAGEPVMSGKGASGLRSGSGSWSGALEVKRNWQDCPCPAQPYLEYGYDEVYVQVCDQQDYHTGKYQCVKGEQDSYEGLCHYQYVKDCHHTDKGAIKVRRYWKKVYYDESFEQDCKNNHAYFGQLWSNWQDQRCNSWSGQDWVTCHTNTHNNNNWREGNNWNNGNNNNWREGGNWNNGNHNNNNWREGSGSTWTAPGGAGRNLGSTNNNHNQNQWSFNHWQPQRWTGWQDKWSNDWTNSWGSNQWRGDSKWYSQYYNAWQPGCKVPNVPRYEYGYDLVPVKLCTTENYHTGEYLCIKGHEQQRHGDNSWQQGEQEDSGCRFHYVKRCATKDSKPEDGHEDCGNDTSSWGKPESTVKLVKVYWKKVYFDRDYEAECHQNAGNWESWGHKQHQGNNWQWQQQEWKQPREQKWSESQEWQRPAGWKQA